MSDEPVDRRGGPRRDTALETGLRGVRVLVTRPVHQAEALARLIESAGGQAVRLPTVEIVAPADPKALGAVFDRLHEFAIAIFISPNAVIRAVPLLRARGRVPATLQLAAVGQGTRRALQEAGYESVLAPDERFDSESLLELLPQATVTGKNILIVRGEGGRERLSEALAARGARVSYAECYRRVPPRQPDAAVLARIRRGEIDILTITGLAGLRNLYELVGESGRARLLATPALFVSQRQAQAARELGFSAERRVAAQASDAAILTELLAWRAAWHLEA